MLNHLQRLLRVVSCSRLRKHAHWVSTTSFTHFPFFVILSFNESLPYLVVGGSNCTCHNRAASHFLRLRRGKLALPNPNSPFSHFSQKSSTSSAKWREKSLIHGARTNAAHLTTAIQQMRTTTVTSVLEQIPSQMDRGYRHHPQADEERNPGSTVPSPFLMTT